MVSIPESLVHIAPVGIQQSAIVAAHSEAVTLEVGHVRVDQCGTLPDGIQGVYYDVKVFVLYFDQVQRFLGRYLIVRGYCGDRLADVEHLVAGHDAPVSDRAGAEVAVREVIASDDGAYSRQLLCLAGIDAHNAGVATRTGQHLAHEHVWQIYVGGVSGAAGDLVQCVHAREAAAKDIMFSRHSSHSSLM